ncbi:MAG: Patatin [Nocardioides sp.]|jgi:NTE family protein|nr:Patatin [Nocardioides sp.]
MATARTIFVLSGGGSRGAGQVGMLRALHHAGVAPDVLVGASVGAVNACFVAAHPGAAGVGALAERWLGMRAESLCGHRRGVVANVARRRPYLFSADPFRRMVRAWVPTWHLENLPVSVRVATTDIATGRAVHHDHGYIPDLLAASAALPGLFPPVVLHGPAGPSTHVDAGISENVPLSGALDLARPGDRVVVLDVTRTPQSHRALRSPLDVLIASLVAAVRNRADAELPAGVEVVRCKLDEEFDCGGVFDFRHTGRLFELGEEAVRAALAATGTAGDLSAA